MAGIVGIFATIGEHIPIFRREKISEPSPEGEINRLHYRGTCLIILIMCLMVTCTEWIARSDSLIDCLHQGPIPQEVINNYCYIMGTFSVPKHYVSDSSSIGRQIVETGVGPFDPEKDYVSFKAYYQWVPFVLFLQGLMFYTPHLVFKTFEGGKIKLILAGLNQWVLDDDDRNSKEEELSKYIIETKGMHMTWCFKLMLAHFLYLINVVGQMFLTDCFLGYEFYKYGLNAASFFEVNEDDTINPMSKVFPRMTKCTFLKYGPSGTLQRHDAQCLLPINIINEKIYVFLWFWFGFLSFCTVIDIIWNMTIILSRRSRIIIIRRKLKLCPRRKELDVDIDLIADFIGPSDWKLLYHLLRNMDSMAFGEFLERFTHDIRKITKHSNCDDCLQLKNLLDPQEGAKKQPNKEDFLSLDKETDL